MNRKIAVIGCGYWGKNLVRNLDDLNSLNSICDIDKNKTMSLQKMYPDVVVYDDYKSLFANTEVEAVVISTPISTHYHLTKQALLSDKDVFVEKPLALDYDEGKELVSLAREKQKILMVGDILQYHPALIKLKKMVKKGDIGNIKYVYSNRLNIEKIRTEENILWSFAPHDISIILDLLEEMPSDVAAHGGNYLNPNKTDITITTMTFSSGVKAHLFVSWLHPYKEQKLVVIGGKKMVMFDNINSEGKLYVYSHKIDWIERIPVPRPEDAHPIEVEKAEPLSSECEHFIECITSRTTPKTNGQNGLKVLEVLKACQESLEENGKLYYFGEEKNNSFFVHESSFIDENVEIGKKTKIWHFSHIMQNTKIGENCTIGQNVMVGPNVTIGNNVKIQNNVSVYDGVVLEDDVFCGPSMTFTNVVNPRSHWPRKDEYKKTLVKRGASLGANSTIVCGHTIGQYAFIGAGALANKDIPDYALAYGIPARIQGWMCYCGVRLDLSAATDSNETAVCKDCGKQYKKEKMKVFPINE